MSNNANKDSTELTKQREARALSFYANQLELGDPTGLVVNRSLRGIQSSQVTQLRSARTTQLSLTLMQQLASTNSQFTIIRNPTVYTPITTISPSQPVVQVPTGVPINPTIPFTNPNNDEIVILMLQSSGTSANIYTYTGTTQKSKSIDITVNSTVVAPGSSGGTSPNYSLTRVVAYNGYMFVFAFFGRLYYSTDLRSYTEIPNTPWSSYTLTDLPAPMSVTWGLGKWWIGCTATPSTAAGTVLYTTLDFSVFTPVLSHSTYFLSQPLTRHAFTSVSINPSGVILVYGNVANGTGTPGTTVMRSTDGVNFTVTGTSATTIGQTPGIGMPTAARWLNNRWIFTGIGKSTQNIFHSTDGTTWTNASWGGVNYTYDAAYFSSKYVVTLRDDSTYAITTSTDLTTWAAGTTNIWGAGNGRTANIDTDGTKLWICGRDLATASKFLFFTTDLTNWTEISGQANTGGYAHMFGVCSIARLMTGTAW